MIGQNISAPLDNTSVLCDNGLVINAPKKSHFYKQSKKGGKTKMEKQRFTISLPKDMYHVLKEQAQRDHRTLGEEITYLLEIYVPAYQRVLNHEFKIPTPENPTGQFFSPTANGKRTIIG